MPSEHETLVEQASKHDADAMYSLLGRHLPGLRAFIRLRTGPALREKESSSDLAQSVCREVLEELDDFEYRGEAEFRGFLFTKALTKIQDRVRFYGAQKRDAARELPGADRFSGYYASLGTPSQEAISREEIERIEATFDQLPDHYREVLTLTRVAGLTHKQVAERMGRSEGSVNGLVDRALIRLSWLLSRHGGIGE